MSSTSSLDIAEDFFEPKFKDVSNPEIDYFVAGDAFYANSSHLTAVSKEHSISADAHFSGPDDQFVSVSSRPPSLDGASQDVLSHWSPKSLNSDDIAVSSPSSAGMIRPPNLRKLPQSASYYPLPLESRRSFHADHHSHVPSPPYETPYDPPFETPYDPLFEPPLGTPFKNRSSRRMFHSLPQNPQSVYDVSYPDYSRLPPAPYVQPPTERFRVSSHPRAPVLPTYSVNPQIDLFLDQMLLPDPASESLSEPSPPHAKRPAEPSNRRKLPPGENNPNARSGDKLCFEYMNTGRCKRMEEGRVCRYRHLVPNHPDAIADRFRSGYLSQKEIEQWQLRECDEFEVNPFAPREAPICFEFLNRGVCSLTENMKICRYRHLLPQHPDAIADMKKKGKKY